MARAHPKATWAKLKSAYRRGEGSIADLAPKFGVAPATAERRCTVEKWVVERREVAGKAQAKATARDVDSLAELLAADRRRVEAGLTIFDSLAQDMKASAKKRSAGSFDRLMSGLAAAIRQQRLAHGIDPDQPVAGDHGKGKQRIIVRGGAALPAAPAVHALPPVRTGT